MYGLNIKNEQNYIKIRVLKGESDIYILDIFFLFINLFLNN